MKAALLHDHGTPVEYGDRADPIAGPGQQIVRVSAAPIVPLDLLCASGTSYFGRQPVPYVPGVQGVGLIESTGVRVWFATSAGMAPGDGSLAERCVVSESDLVPITADVSDALVAAIGTSGIAAWMCLTWRAQLTAGERVVVLGANGVVGQIALVVARHLGAAHIVAVQRRAGSVAGADEVVVLDPAETRTQLTARLLEAAGGPVDVVLDPVFGEPAAAAAHALAPFGRLINLGGSAGDAASFSSAALRGKTISVLGYTNNAISPAQRAEALTQVLALAEDGLLTVDHRVRPLAECRDAWLAAGSGPRTVLAT